jgi:hypothetical protein
MSQMGSLPDSCAAAKSGLFDDLVAREMAVCWQAGMAMVGLRDRSAARRYDLLSQAHHDP